MRTGALLLSLAVLLSGCSDAPTGKGGDAPRTPSGSPSASASPTERPTPDRPPPLTPDVVRTSIAVRAVHHLAGRIGPWMATGPAFDRAAIWVQRRLTTMGYAVHREPFPVPAGNSWGVPVDAGTSRNLVAAPPGIDRSRPHLIIGAHLDTVPQAPGAEDNASGVGVLLAVAQATAGRRTRLPVVFVVFGAEEPRGASDDDHHYGSRHHVGQLNPAQRRAMRGMLALDRVGVGDVVPVCSAGGPDPMRAQVLTAAERADVPTEACVGNRSSDHWSFVRDGLPGARLGSTPYSGYHSEGDMPSVVSRVQLDRTARVAAAWLSPRV